LKKNLFKFSLDIGMAIAFLLLFNPEVTGLAFHEIASLVFGLAMLIHVLLNWKWVMSVSKKVFSKNIQGKMRLSYVLNISLLLDMFLILMSGLFISKVLLPDFRYFPNINWLPIHIVSSFIGLVLVGIHIGLHWNWIKQMGKRFPKLVKLFSFQKPSRKLVSRFILIIGTVALLAQVPKQVLLTQAIVSNQSYHQEKREGPERAFSERGEESEQKLASRGNELGSEDEEFRERTEDHEGPFSIFRLIGIFPVLIMYSAIFGSIAFYTYLVEKRCMMKRNKTS
jgi:Domain of unknown function (DUF4405)